MLNSTATHIVEMYRNTGISVYPYNEDLRTESCQKLPLTWENFDFFDLSAVGELHLFGEVHLFVTSLPGELHLSAKRCTSPPGNCAVPRGEVHLLAERKVQFPDRQVNLLLERCR